MSNTTPSVVKGVTSASAVSNTDDACGYFASIGPLGLEPRYPTKERIFAIAPKQEAYRNRCIEVSAYWGTDYGFCIVCGRGFPIETAYEKMGLCSKCAGDVTKAFHEKTYGEPHPDLDSKRYAEEMGRLKKARAHLKPKRSISPKMRLKVFERDEYQCRRCGTSKDLRVDHVHPESKGGAYALENFQTLCARCNSKKGDRVEGGGAA